MYVHINFKTHIINMNLPLQPKVFMHLLYTRLHVWFYCWKLLINKKNYCLHRFCIVHTYSLALENVCMHDTRSHVTCYFLFVILLILLSITCASNKIYYFCTQLIMQVFISSFTDAIVELELTAQWNFIIAKVYC